MTYNEYMITNPISDMSHQRSEREYLAPSIFASRTGSKLREWISNKHITYLNSGGDWRGRVSKPRKVESHTCS